MGRLPKCPKCGRTFSWAYYYRHVKKCKGRRKGKQKKLDDFSGAPNEVSVRDSKTTKGKAKKRKSGRKSRRSDK